MTLGEQLPLDPADEIDVDQLSAMDLPDGWTLRRLEEVAPINMGQSPPGDSYNTTGIGVPLLNGPTEFGPHHPTPAQWTTAPTKMCDAGDILLCVRGATTGRMNWADRAYCIGRGLAALTPNPQLCVPHYVYYYVYTQTRAMLELAAGSTFPNLAGARLKTMPIPTPPLPEQRRIVARIEELATRIERARGLRREAAEEVGMALTSAINQTWGDTGEWSSQPLGQLATLVSGQIDPRIEPFASLPHINGEVIEAGTCRLLPYRLAKEDGVTSGKYHFQAGSILYSKIRPYLRKAVQVPVEGVCSADVYAFDSIDQSLEPRFLMYSLVSPDFTEYANSLSNRARIPKLNQEQLMGYDLSYPPLPEQRRIVAYLDGVQARAEAARRAQAESAAELEALLPAVLARAFRGEL